MGDSQRRGRKRRRATGGEQLIKEISRDYIRAEFDGRSVRVEGEMLVSGLGPADYVIERDSLRSWDEPNSEPIDEGMKEHIISSVVAEMQKAGWKVLVE